MTTPQASRNRFNAWLHSTASRDRSRSNAARSKSHGHADMAARKSQPLVKSLRIDAGVMRQQFDQLAAPGCALPRPPIAPAARRCRGCGNGWRRGHPRSGRARRPANSAPAGCRAAGSRPRRPRRPRRRRAGCSDRGRPSRTPRNRIAAADLRSARAAPPSGSSASMATMTPTSSRRARRMVISEMADMTISGEVSAPAAGREIFRSRRSSAAPRHSRRDESRLHAPGGYRPAARRRRARRRRRPETA